ncbi:sugar ABC transporter substrate-binding protein [Geodermatophilus ruber]|uniref:Ribose transport system substrate-binding protein n=1 Tax=Geodermatophilus ruber TaxID=504800 RepID=A0A1I4KLL8_9ACTN|nr:substrate-binding domain-containing protein [Geodermatophilus ruber]SFL79644.1 ribose transport system substrate-binding protein [Geodermatophilus ruber]
MRKPSRVTMVAAMALLAVLSACSSGAESQSAAGAAEGDLAAAQERIDQFSQVPEFEAPGEPFDAAAAMSGRTIASVPVNAAIDFTQFYRQAAERIADSVGFEYTTWQNQGRPSEWGQGIQAALADDADVIELFAGIDPGQVSPQMVEAERAGIPVVSTDGYDVEQEPDGSLAAAVNCPCSEAARLMADWVTVQTNGAGRALVITSSDIKPSEAAEEAIKDEFAEVCPGCQVEYIDVPSADWATKILPQVQSALVADSEIDYVLPLYDTMSIWASQAIIQAGRSDSVHIATYNGTPSILAMMRESDLIEMNVGQSNDWMAHVTLDQQMRLVAGLPTNPDATWPLYIWTHDNLDQAGDPPTDSQGYGDAYQEGFRTLWGLN